MFAEQGGQMHRTFMEYFHKPNCAIASMIVDKFELHQKSSNILEQGGQTHRTFAKHQCWTYCSVKCSLRLTGA